MRAFISIAALAALAIASQLQPLTEEGIKADFDSVESSSSSSESGVYERASSNSQTTASEEGRSSEEISYEQLIFELAMARRAELAAGWPSTDSDYDSPEFDPAEILAYDAQQQQTAGCYESLFMSSSDDSQ